MDRIPEGHRILWEEKKYSQNFQKYVLNNFHKIFIMKNLGADRFTLHPQFLYDYQS